MAGKSMFRRMRDCQGFTLVELLMVVSIIGVVAAIATPGLLRSRMAGNEASAIASLRAIVSAQQDFAVLNRGYADDLASLAGTCPGGTAPFISPDLAANGIEKNGYTFTVMAGLGAETGPSDCFGNPTQTTYYATATALAVGTTGTRGFAANVGSAIWQDTSGALPTEPFIMSGTVGPLGR